MMHSLNTGQGRNNTCLYSPVKVNCLNNSTLKISQRLGNFVRRSGNRGQIYDYDRVIVGEILRGPRVGRS